MAPRLLEWCATPFTEDPNDKTKSTMAGGVMSALIVWPSSWCQKKEVPEERSGKEIDKIVGKAGQHTEKVSEKIDNEQMQMETLSVIAILGKKWSVVMTKDQAGYFVQEWVPEWQAFRYQAIRVNRRPYEDEGAGPFLLRSGEGETSVAEAYPCPG